jgi:centriolar protein POC1
MKNPYPVRTFKGNRERVNCIKFHPELKQIASGSDDSSICLWNVEDNKFSFKLVGHKGPVQEIDFSPTGNLIASASKDNSVKIWNNKYDGSFSTLKSHTAGVNSVQFFNEGANLLSGSDDKSMIVWSYKDLAPLARLEGHARAVNSVRVSHDNKLAISGSDDGCIKLWDIERGIDLLALKEDRSVYGVRFNPESSSIATCGEDSVINIYDVRSKFEIAKFYDHQGTSTSIDFHPHEPYLLSGGEDAKVRLYDLRQNVMVRTVNANHIGTNSVAFSKHGDYFGCGGEDKMVMVWKLNLLSSGKERISQANESIGPVEHDSLNPKSHLDKDNYISHIKKVTNINRANGKTIYNQKPETNRTQGSTLKKIQDGLEVKYVLSEDLNQKLLQINTNLEMISRTINVMGQRIGNNEKALEGVIEYLSEKHNADIFQQLENNFNN